jgi:hypothetical protein
MSAADAPPALALAGPAARRAPLLLPLPALGCLPGELALAVLLLLPLRWRVQAEAVCRGWRAALRVPALWHRLDLAPMAAAATDAVLDALTARANGQLRFVDVSGCGHVSARALLRVAAAAAPGGALTIRAPALWWSSDQARVPRGTLATRALRRWRLISQRALIKLTSAALARLRARSWWTRCASCRT